MVAAVTPPPPPGVANKDQRELKQGLGVQDPTQPTTDLERQSHIADSVGKREKLGKVTLCTVGSDAVRVSSHLSPLISGGHYFLHQTRSCGRASVLRLGYYFLLARPCALLYCYGLGLLLQCYPTIEGLTGMPGPPPLD